MFCAEAGRVLLLLLRKLALPWGECSGQVGYSPSSISKYLYGRTMGKLQFPALWNISIVTFVSNAWLVTAYGIFDSSSLSPSYTSTWPEKCSKVSMVGRTLFSFPGETMPGSMSRLSYSRIEKANQERQTGPFGATAHSSVTCWGQPPTTRRIISFDYLVSGVIKGTGRGNLHNDRFDADCPVWQW